MSNELIASIISLSPKTGGTLGMSREVAVQHTIKEL